VRRWGVKWLPILPHIVSFQFRPEANSGQWWYGAVTARNPAGGEAAVVRGGNVDRRNLARYGY
jgi:hypothetical protein